jgi:hypothetical protein
MKKSTKVGLAVGGVVLAALIALGVYEEMKKPAAQTTGVIPKLPNLPGS